MRRVSRCPYCREEFVAWHSDQEAFRTLILAHLMECTAVSSSLTFRIAAVIVDELLHSAPESPQ